MSMKRLWVFMALLLILGLAFASHGILAPITPWDTDEPGYVKIAQNIQQFNCVCLHVPDVWTYHPPFHEKLLSLWFGITGHSDIESGRLLSNQIATMLVIVIFLTVKWLTGDDFAALLASLFYATDGWMVYSSTLVKFDTAAMLIGAVGILFFAYSIERGSPKSAVYAGVFIGGAAIYKHVAALFIFAVILHWVLWKFLKLEPTFHKKIVMIAGAVIGIYFIGMIVLVGSPFLTATAVQIRRTLGLQEARGLQYGLSEAVTALSQTYWAFSGSVIFVLFGLGCGIYKAYLHIWKRSDLWIAPITTWLLAAAIFLAAIRLRNPHYLVFLIVPSIIIGSVQLREWWLTSKRLRHMATIIIVGICLLNARTLFIRATDYAQSNALAELQTYMQTVPADMVVLADEPICAMISQPCAVIGQNQSANQIAQVNPKIVITYTTVTLQLPTNQAFLDLLSRSTEIHRITGWKEVLTVNVVDLPPQ